MHKLKLDLYDFPELYTVRSRMDKLASISGGTSLFSKEELNLLPDSDFALVIKEGAASHRKFPIVDKPNAYASALMFGKTKDQLPVAIRNKVAASIAAAIQGGTTDNVVISSQDFEHQTKEASLQSDMSKRASLNDNDFALVIDKDGTKRRLYPIYTEELCKTAADYFSKNWVNIPVDFRHKFAFALTNKVREEKYNVKLGSEIKQYYNDSFNPNLEAAIVSRKNLIDDTNVKKAYDLLLEKHSEAHPIKVAHLLRDIDKIAGLDNSKYVKDAYASVFNPNDSATEKEAGVTIVGDYKFDPNTLTTMPYDKFSHLFTPEDYSELQASPVENYNALPKTYQDQIASIAQG